MISTARSTKANRRGRRGQSIIEMTFVGIPMIFVLISIFEISRGMWMYHTLAHAVKSGVRYATVHGYNCTKNGNSCSVTVAQIAQVVQDAGVGLDVGKTQLRFYTGPTDANGTSKTIFATCNFVAGGGNTACSANANTFPPSSWNGVGQAITIDIQTPFNSAIAMFWPGSKAQSFSVTTFPASSTDTIKF